MKRREVKRNDRFITDEMPTGQTAKANRQAQEVFHVSNSGSDSYGCGYSSYTYGGARAYGWTAEVCFPMKNARLKPASSNGRKRMDFGKPFAVDYNGK